MSNKRLCGNASCRHLACMKGEAYSPHSPWSKDILGQWHWCKPPNYTEAQSRLREAKFKLGRTES